MINKPEKPFNYATEFEASSAVTHLKREGRKDWLYCAYRLSPSGMYRISVTRASDGKYIGDFGSV